MGLFQISPIQETPRAFSSPVQVQNVNRINEGFDNALSDFERALQRSKNQLSNNLPDVTAVSGMYQCEKFVRQVTS